MTILIGALSDNGNTVILVADKLTMLQPQALVFSHDSKGIELTPYSVVLTSGFTSNYIFIEDVKFQVKENMNLRQTSETLAYWYRVFRNTKVTSEILAIHGFSTFEEFHNKQRFLSEGIVAGISEQMKFYSLNVDLILGGFDDTGHLYHIMNPGTAYNHDSPGFCCAGMGANRASPIFEFFNYSIDLPLSDVLSIAFIAKKRTEILGGIGKETDIWIITKSGIKKITGETIFLLEKKYNEVEKDFSFLLEKVKIKQEEIKI